MLSDLRLTLRSLVKARGFAFVAVLTLAVGIGSSTIIFSALRVLVVNPFDYPRSEQLAQVWSGDHWPLSPADYLDIEEQMTSFSAFGCYSPQSVNIGAADAQAVAGVNATAGVLQAFGVPPLHGRWLMPEDDLKGAARVAVISYSLWQRRYNADTDIVGSSVRMNGSDVTVVGVMPKGFEFAGPWIRETDTHVWLPMSLEDEKEKRDSHWLCGIARLKEGVSVESADREIKAIGKRLSELYPNSNTRKELLIRSLHFEMTEELGPQIWLLFVAVALVLLVACANVASMLLARSAARQGEFGVRIALGATRWALVRLALLESLVLALAGAAVGLFIAYGGIEAFKAVAPTSDARKAAMGLDAVVLAFAFGAALLTALLAGLPPMLATARSSIAAIVRDDARGAVGSRSRHSMLRGLVIAQVAVAFVLAIGAALFSKSYLKLLDENSSIDTDRVLTARLSLRGERYQENEERVRFWKQLEERLKAIPGVSSVGLTSKQPLIGGSNTNALVNDEVYDPSQKRILVERSSVTADYFAAMGMTILQGRNLLPQDDMQEGGLLGVVVNRAMVERAWPDKDPIGQVMRANQPGDPWYTATVVGVVENVKQWGPAAEVQPEMFTTPPGHWGSTVNLNVRSAQPAVLLSDQVRKAIEELDPELAPEHMRSMRQLVRDTTQRQRSVAGMINLFMGTALGLVAVGLYGTLSYSIVQRTRELGVRMAVGASRSKILGLVFTQGIRWVAIGLALGVGGSFALSKVLANLVYGMEGLGAPPLALATAVVTAAALGACWAPARRAAGMDPLVALRGE